MVKYGEPLISGVDPKLGPQVAAALHAKAQLLSFFSFVLGRREASTFKMSTLFEADAEFHQLMTELDTEAGEAAYDAITKIVNSALQGTLPTFLQGKEGNIGSDRNKLSRLISIISPLIDSYATETAQRETLSKQLIGALAALEAGEVPDLFKAESRKVKPRKSYSVSVIKYEFYLMNKIMKEAGFKSDEINSLYTKYAKAAWNSVNRWKDTVKKALTEETMREIEDKMREIAESGVSSSKVEAKRIMRELNERFVEASN